jgi:YfiH family protein
VILNYHNGASYYQFENLVQFAEIRHGIFTRHFGSSPAPFESLNVSFGLGDANVHVRENRVIVARAMGCTDLVSARQVHGNQVLVLNSQKHNVDDGQEQVLGAGDAMVTDVAGKYLMIQLADCQSILLYDATRRIVANIHSGWRGSVSNIAGQTVGVMTRRFQSDPAHIMAGIGPSLGPCCAEFIHYKKELPEILWPYKLSNDYFDFWAISRDQLCKAGLLAENIEIAGICTRCHTSLFFSYRGEGQTGRFASVIGLNGELRITNDR